MSDLTGRAEILLLALPCRFNSITTNLFDFVYHRQISSFSDMYFIQRMIHKVTK